MGDVEERSEFAHEAALWDSLADAARTMVARAIELWGQPEVGTDLYRSWRWAIDQEIMHADSLLRRHPERLELATGRPKRRQISGAVRIQVFERDAYRCVECGSWRDLTVDHIIPVVAGGADCIENFQTLCRSCNSSKGARV